MKITSELIQEWLSIRCCDVPEKISDFPKTQDYCPESFASFQDMMNFLKGGYLGESVTSKLKTAYNRAIKKKKTGQQDYETNIAFCKQFFNLCLQPDSNELNPWLNHCLKHFIIQNADPQKVLCLENVITQDSYFNINSYRSAVECNELGETTVNTIFLCDWTEVMRLILENYPIFMTCENGDFVFRAAEIITNKEDGATLPKLLDYVELPSKLMPLN